MVTVFTIVLAVALFIVGITLAFALMKVAKATAEAKEEAKRALEAIILLEAKTQQMIDDKSLEITDELDSHVEVIEDLKGVTNDNALMLEDAINELYETSEELVEEATEDERRDEQLKASIQDLSEGLQLLGDALTKAINDYTSEISRLDCSIGALTSKSLEMNSTLLTQVEVSRKNCEEIENLKKDLEDICDATGAAFEATAEALTSQSDKLTQLEEMSEFVYEKIDEGASNFTELQKQVSSHNGCLISVLTELEEFKSKQVEDEQNIASNLEKIKSNAENIRLSDMDIETIYNILFGEDQRGLLERVRDAEMSIDVIMEKMREPKEREVINALSNIFRRYNED